MRNIMLHALFVVAAATPLGSALAASGDVPTGPGGVAGAAPRAEAAAVVTPSRGAATVTLDALRDAGAVIPGEEAFPANGMATVAYGKVGKKGESIINWDSRTQAYTLYYPNRAIVFIEYSGSHLCTGWLYSPNTIVTAGHCVHTGGSSGAWRSANLYKVYPGRNGRASPYGYCTVKWLRSVVGWTVSGNYRYDYGAMRLNCNVGNTVGWFGMYQHASPVGQPAIIGGYPGDKPRTQWTSADRIRYVSPEMIGYRMDTVGGHSGSPIWHDRNEGLATNGAWGIGVHNYGVGALGTNANSAARLTTARINNYITWKNQP